MFDLLPPLAESPFDELQREYDADPRERKLLINTGTIVGTDGQTLRLKCVDEAEHWLANNPYSKSYPPSAGIPEFLEAARKLLGIQDAAAVATPSCGALELIFQLLRRCGVSRIVTTSPTWGMYPMFAEVAGLSFKAVSSSAVELAANLEKSDALLLQASCSNPSGVDLMPEDYEKITDILKSSGRACVLDVAYQGVKCDIMEDTAFKPLFSLQNTFCAQFFDKNFSIYAEGASVVYAIDKRIEPHLESLVSGLFGLTPVHGQWLVATVVERYFSEYRAEMSIMRAEIAEKRTWLSGKLKTIGAGFDITEQNGIYAYLDLNEAEITKLRTLGVYVVEGGRLNLGSVTESNVEILCHALRQLFE